MRLLRFAKSMVSPVILQSFLTKGATYSMLDFTPHRLEELDTNLGASWIILDKENPRFPRRPRQSRISRRTGVRMCLDVDGLRGRYFLHGVRTRVIGHRIGNLVNMI